MLLQWGATSELVLFVLYGDMYFMIKYTACVSGVSINI